MIDGQDASRCERRHAHRRPALPAGRARAARARGLRYIAPQLAALRRAGADTISEGGHEAMPRGRRGEAGAAINMGPLSM